MPLLSGPTTPNWQRHQALPPIRFGLFPFRSPLLRESLLLSFPQGTEMFQFPWFPLPALCVQAGVTPHDGCRVSPFGHPRITSYKTLPRGLSWPDHVLHRHAAPGHPPSALVTSGVSPPSLPQAPACGHPRAPKRSRAQRLVSLLSMHTRLQHRCSRAPLHLVTFPPAYHPRDG